MNMFLFSDPHIGLHRSSHTSVRSQALLRERLYATALNLAVNGSANHKYVLCGGDLFDRYTNREDVIGEGYAVSRSCNFILAGNHDLKNNIDTVSSLQLLALTDDQNRFVISPNGAEPYFECREICDGEIGLYFIPHCFTQGIFEASVQEVCEASKNDIYRASYLILHCNVGAQHGKTEDEGTSLYISDELQGLVSKSFTRVFIGHEHQPRTMRKNIHVMGNTFPVHFGEIGPRYTYSLDLDNNTLSQSIIFDPDQEYLEISAIDFLVSGGDLKVNQGLVQITGDIEAESYASMSRALLKFWKLNEETLYAVKNATTVIRAENVHEVKVDGTRATLREIIASEVEKAGFAVEFAEISAEVPADA